MDSRQFMFVYILMLAFAGASRKFRNRKNLRDKFADDNGGTCELQITCKENVNFPVKLPIKGPRGPPGNPGRKGANGKPGPPGKPGTPGKSIQSQAKLSFFVGLSKNYGPIKESVDLKYDGVVTNDGDCYDIETGRFTAPVNGTYHFTVVVAAQGRQKAAVMLMVEGKMVFTVWAESIPTWSTGSNSAILHLYQGQQVWQILIPRASALHGYMYSSFSGFLLYQDNND